MNPQSLYQKAILFAAEKHEAKNQKVPGTNLPYLLHLSNVAMEILIASAHTENFDLGFAVQVALLHDTLEDTDTTFQELEEKFGLEVAEAVAALTKNERLTKEERMNDCLERIRKLKPEVWAVKLADRITNLQPPPPDWDKEKIEKYYEEAKTIWCELGSANGYLGERIHEQIAYYAAYYLGGAEEIPIEEVDNPETDEENAKTWETIKKGLEDGSIII